MNITQIQTLIPIAHKAGVTIRLVGRHGAGKTQVIKQAAKKLFGNNCVIIHGSQNDVGDLIGLADFKVNEKGERVATKFFKPDWWPRDPNSKGIIFLDEFSRARTDLQQAMFPLALERELHGDVLPPGWTVIVADNPPTDDYKTEHMEDEALMDRFLHIKFSPRNDEFFAFAKDREFSYTDDDGKIVEKTGFNRDILNFLQQNEEVLYNTKLKEFTIDRKPSNRSWDTAERLFQVGIPEDMFLETMGGMVGIENASRLRAYMEQNRSKPLTAEQVLNDYTTHRKQFQGYCDFSSGRHDVVNISADNVSDYLFTLDDLTPAQRVNMTNFLNDIPVDIGYALFLKTYLETNKDGKKMAESISNFLNENEKFDDIIMNDKFKPVKPEETTNG